mgnify:CR=1 FL=1
MIKHLITGGCSFSHSQTPTENWIGFLENHLKEQNNELTIEHTGFLSQGQELIQKKAMLAAMDAMNRGISPSDILITVMWSGSYRKAWYIDNLYILNIKKGRQNYLTESDLHSRILFISKLKLENLFRNAEKIEFIFDVT